jgi:D-cysteine desulfhydrase family pyridoxal phosphate-dependent enzyme
MKQLARALRKHQTDAEKLLWNRLRNRQVENCKFRRQQAVGPYITDFLCLEPKLVIELDGGQHSTQMEQDEQRTRYLQSFGYRVLRFWNHEVLRETDAVLEAIRVAMAIKSPHPVPLPEGEGENFHDALWKTIEQLQRQPLAEFPTPLLPMRRLGRALGDLDLWFKRDDLISFGLGGNKVRGLEFLMADAMSRGADIIVTGAGPQSNHVRATAAAAACCGLRCTAVFWGDAPEHIDGNYRITRMLGAETVFTGDPDRASVDQKIHAVCEELRRQGRRPYPIPRGGACALGALGHALAARELHEQCRKLGFTPDLIVLAAGSGGTHAGWLVGTRALDSPWAVESFTVSREAEAAQTEIARLATGAAALLGLDWRFAPDEAIVHGGFIGQGYGIPSPEAADAIRLVGRSEGVLLDPTYTGKAMAGFLDHLRRGLVAHRSIVFLHTGGEPAFLAGEGEWLA